MPRPFNARTNRRNDGSGLMFIKDLSVITKDHLPETIFADDPRKAMSKDPWGTTRLRPEVRTVLEALAQRHQDRTGKPVTASEIVAGALAISLPTLARFFPRVTD